MGGGTLSRASARSFRRCFPTKKRALEGAREVGELRLRSQLVIGQGQLEKSFRRGLKFRGWSRDSECLDSSIRWAWCRG